MNVNYTIVKTEIAEVVFSHRKEENPCALCAKMRKGAFNQAAVDLGCNKIAYAHHKDDIIDTLFLSLIFEGKYYSFSPFTHLDKMNIDLIRPLIYVPETEILGFKNKYQLPVIKNPCPADGYTKREEMHELIHSLQLKYPGVKERLFSSVENGTIPDWINALNRTVR